MVQVLNIWFALNAYVSVKAIGFRDSHILKVIVYEVAFISIVSGFVGYLISMPATSIITPFLTMEGNSSNAFDFIYLPLAVGISVVVGIIAGIYPAIRATRMDPTVAFRAI